MQQETWNPPNSIIKHITHSTALWGKNNSIDFLKEKKPTKPYLIRMVKQAPTKNNKAKKLT